MRHLLFLFIIFLQIIQIKAQTCFALGVTFSTQDQIDNFAADYPDCNMILGPLIIHESSPGEITNLNGLSQLTALGHDLVILSNTNLGKLAGLDHITSVPGSLKIIGNDELDHLQNLKSITSIGGDLLIQENDDLNNLDGLHHITHIGGDFSIIGNDDLTKINRLDDLATMGLTSSIVINNNIGLTQVESFGALASIDKNLDIYSNDVLTDLSGFNNISYIGGSLYIGENNSLTNLDGFGSLSTVHYLDIYNNANLVNLNGLENLTLIKKSFFLYNNDAMLNISGLNNLVTIAEVFVVSENDNLVSFVGLDALSSCKELFVKNNNSLLNFNGLASLTEIIGLFRVENCSINTFEGLDNLSSIQGSLIIKDNEHLNNLNGLEGLQSISGTLGIIGNINLLNIVAAQNIDPNTILSMGVDDDLVIKDNVRLSPCEIQNICSFLNIPGRTNDISNNKAGCNNETEVLNACDGPDCTILSDPIDGETDVDINTELTWSSVISASGYLLTVGTSSGGSDILDNVDVPFGVSYDPEDFPCNTDIYVTIIPYSYAEEAIGCMEESFTTEDVIAFAGSDVNICSDGNPIQLQASGGTSYSWTPTTGLDNPNISNPLASPSMTTIYTVQVSTDNGCFDTDEVVVTVNTPPSPNASSTDETAYNANDGTATCNPINGVAPYIFSWNNGENTQTIVNLSPGNYVVSVTDAIGCQSSEVISVAEFICPVLTINDNLFDISCFGECDGVIQISGMTNGVAPFTYLWSNGSIASTLGGLCMGDYTVTVTDAMNCSKSKSFNISEPTELFANASSTDETANDANDGTATANPSGGIPPYFYFWSNGASTQTINGLADGDFSVTVTDSNGCIDVQIVDINEFICPVLTVNSTQQDVSCFGECDAGVQVTGMTNGVAPFSYLWSNGENTAAIQGLCSGDYTVIVTDSKNCSQSKTFTISQPTELFANASSTDETANDANDGTATANPSGGVGVYTYNWSNGLSTQTISNLSAGEYTVTVTDANNCTKVQIVIVEEFVCPVLIISENQQDVSCFGECDAGVQVTGMTNGVAPFSYLWSNGENTAAIQGICSGDYTVTVTDSKNCSQSKTFTISQPTELFANASSTDETANDANDGTATANTSGGTFPFSYGWSNGSSTISIVNLTPGTYIVTVTDDNLCQSIESVIVQEFECPSLSIVSDVVDVSCFESCDGQISISTVNNSLQPLTYFWSNGENSSSLENLCIGNYSVTVIDASNCSVVETFAIAQPTELLVSIASTNETAIDANDGTAIASPSGGVPGYTYAWSNGETSQSIDNLAPGSYIVTVVDQNGCSKIETISIAEYGCQNLTIDINQINVSCFESCNGQIEITGITNGSSPYTYSWSNGSSDSIIQNLCQGSYNLTVVDSKGCNVFASYIISEPLLLSANAGAIPESSNQANDGVVFVNPSGGTWPYTYIWSSGSTEASVSGLSPGNYVVTVEDSHACQSIEEVIVGSYACGELSINEQEENVSCFAACDGSIVINSVTNAISPLTYIWNNGELTSSLINLCEGNYSVTITDANNCTVTKNYTIIQPDDIIIRVEEIVDINGDANGSITLTTNDNGNYVFEWIGPNGFSSQSESIEDLENAGCYVLRVIDALTSCSRDTTICINDITSNQDMNLVEDYINIYPNPTDGNFIINFENSTPLAAEIILYDISGKSYFKLFKSRNENILNIDSYELKAGLYLILIEFSDKSRVYKKIVVQKG